MCTALAKIGERKLFGRTLDVPASYGEGIVITPRFLPLSFSDGSEAAEHLALIGMGILKDGKALYFDAMNEAGLCAAALNFPRLSKYFPPRKREKEIASYEFILKILSRCKSVFEAKLELCGAAINDLPFSKDTPTTPLHWIVADGNEAITVESTENGLSVYPNECGVLTNSPDFPFQEKRAAEFSAMSTKNPAPSSESPYFSEGYGAFGLPGDFTSPSRFIRADFLGKSVLTEGDEVSSFFHIMDNLQLPSGAVTDENGAPSKTLYTSCMDREQLVYYFHTYQNRRICAVRLETHAACLSSHTFININKPQDVDLITIK